MALSMAVWPLAGLFPLIAAAVGGAVDYQTAGITTRWVATPAEAAPGIVLSPMLSKRASANNVRCCELLRRWTLSWRGDRHGSIDSEC